MINTEFDSILQIVKKKRLFDIHNDLPIHKTKLYVIRCFR